MWNVFLEVSVFVVAHALSRITHDMHKTHLFEFVWRALTSLSLAVQEDERNDVTSWTLLNKKSLNEEVGGASNSRFPTLCESEKEKKMRLFKCYSTR
ncbi:hypothetical protein OUZ56_026810 [Daphnia magna]|uniref:Secreted protein n=1 Tax=Daphnia magna TaxID=35525 RepID=A0ABQ9ZMW4_9CRUS|nr:hypothetical protein OUZ56_026810 [Daphnia magna]